MSQFQVRSSISSVSIFVSPVGGSSHLSTYIISQSGYNSTQPGYFSGEISPHSIRIVIYYWCTPDSGDCMPTIPSDTPLRQRLADLIRRSQRRQMDLASAAGVSQSWISSVLSGV